MRKFDLNEKYNRSKFVDFLSDFMPEDFSRNVEELHYQGNHYIDDNGQYAIGKSDSLDLAVFEFVFNGERDPRISITREAVKIMQSELCYNAIVVFHNPSYSFWRLSLITTDFVYDENENTKIILSNPKRFSFLLGKDCKKHTPDQFLFVKGRVRDLDDLKSRFAIEAVTKEFYNELFGWYEWACSLCQFPEGRGAYVKMTNKSNNIQVIRLITRLMFVWFIKQKRLVPNWIFDCNTLQDEVLTSFDKTSQNSSNYYNAILQNLFFATLNNPINEREFCENSKGRGVSEHYGVKTLYRDDDEETFFKENLEYVKKRFYCIPYLNGGLFECLDRDETRSTDGKTCVEYVDGFSRRKGRRAFVPNCLFFGSTHDNREGLISLFERYNFTIEENTPSDVEIALDPELLGKVFENLLGTYNPETGETARKASGSFYTPREIVDYMTNVSLKSYLERCVPSLRNGESCEKLLDFSIESVDLTNVQRDEIIKALLNIRTLDMAAGSGAFPMGLLNRIVEVAKKAKPELNLYDFKLNVIRDCIYGVDIQPIAVQISKLRFFISLICEQERNDDASSNYNIQSLPNLETKFIAANSLISVKKCEAEAGLFGDERIERLKKDILELRRVHFSAKTMKEKRDLRKADYDKSNILKNLLVENHIYGDGDARKIAEWTPYNQNNPATFFDAEWMFGSTNGFDIVIGNPPYIQLQNAINEKQKYADIYKYENYRTFERTGDIYCLFYEKGIELLKRDGVLCYITSNKWMRAGYGEALRDFFCQYQSKGEGKQISIGGKLLYENKNVNPLLLIDFGGIRVFKSAMVDTNILLLQKCKNIGQTKCCTINGANNLNNFDLKTYVEKKSSVMSFNDSSSWIILNSIEKSIKKKIEKYGTPLKDWDINIYRGVLTGCNEAFIIDSAKKDEILANCKNEEERARTAKIVRPILRGRDIKRYECEWAGLWLICTYNSYKNDEGKQIERVRIEDYPALKAHLDRFWDKISERDDQGDTPYNLRSCAYMGDFDKPKIAYSEIVRSPQFYFDGDGYFYLDATAFLMTGEHLENMCDMLNSNIVAWLFKKYYAGGGLGENGYRYKKQFIIDLPLPKTIKGFGKNIEDEICDLYHFDSEEKKYINLQLEQLSNM